jgi:hypothetical protein
MGVQAEESGPPPDPAATAALPVLSDTGQGVLFHDPHGYPTFGDTDKIPVVSGAGGRGGPRAPRWLRVAVVIVSLVILAAAAALGLVKAGIIDGSGNGGNQAAGGTNGSTPSTTPKLDKSPLLTSTGPTASGALGYTIPTHAYGITVTTTVGRSWVSISAAGRQPVFAGIVPPNSSQHEVVLGPAQVNIGAGGTKVVVTAGHRSQTLTPPSAPFSYQITPA